MPKRPRSEKELMRRRRQQTRQANEPSDRQPPTHHGWGSGTIPVRFTTDAIPSVTEGKSPAMDFAHGLMQGNPKALQLARDALNRQHSEETLADAFMTSTYRWAKFFELNANQEKS